MALGNDLGRELRALLHRYSDGLPEPDLVSASKERGRTIRRRNIATATIVTILLAGLVSGLGLTTMKWWNVRGVPVSPASAVPSTAVRTSGPNQPIQPGIDVLAKAPNWRAGLEDSEPTGKSRFHVIIEIAYDEETATKAWRDNRPKSNDRKSGLPEEPGIYGSMDAVDFTRQAIVVYTSGESSSCPGWVAGMRTESSGQVALTTSWSGADCTADYYRYRLILAVDRELLPKPSQLPTTDLTIDGTAPPGGSVVTGYPFTG